MKCVMSLSMERMSSNLNAGLFWRKDVNRMVVVITSTSDVDADALAVYGINPEDKTVVFEVKELLRSQLSVFVKSVVDDDESAIAVPPDGVTDALVMGNNDAPATNEHVSKVTLPFAIPNARFGPTVVISNPPPKAYGPDAKVEYLVPGALAVSFAATIDLAHRSEPTTAAAPGTCAAADDVAA